MYIFNSFNYVPLKGVVIDVLKARGVKYKLTKKAKVQEDNLPHSNGFGPKIFQVPLQHLEKARVPIKNGKATVDVPEFLVHACSFIEQHIYTEGIFRKAGSTAKQRELKQFINSGQPLDSSHHVIDVCNIIKLFFREMPEPLLPQYCHEMLLSCLLLSGETAQREALLLSCLLLHLDNIAALTYFMEFLARVSNAAADNKMDAKNLAIVFTPSLMPIDSKINSRSSLTINHHIAVIEMLIKSADELGMVPAPLAAQAALRRSKKRRSASITRMFTGIKKIVGRAPSPPRSDDAPTSTITQRKRKSTELLPPAVMVKRRREMAETTPRLCRMGGYSQSSLRISDNRLRDQLDSPARRKSEGVLGIDDREQEPENEGAKKSSKKGLKTSKSTSNMMMSKKNIERKLSHMTWRKRKSSPKVNNENQEIIDPNAGDKDELVTISRKEYDDMKIRVSSMEKLLEKRHESKDIRMSLESERLAVQLNEGLRLNLDENERKATAADRDVTTAAAVNEAFQRVVVQSEQIGPQLRKSVRLRWSSEGRVARSPSERKIGSIRRRSRELARSNSAGPRTNLQRGRPNTRQTGLRSPQELSGNTKKMSAKNKLKTGSPVSVSSPLRKFCEIPERRDSIVNIRRNNTGMVHAKTKFFDSLNHSTDMESDRSNRSMELRLQSVRNELSLQSRAPLIKQALTTAAQALKTPRSQARGTPRSRATPLKALPLEVLTPMRDTRRSPRILSRKAAHNPI